MSLVIDMICRDGIIVGCDSKLTISSIKKNFTLGYTHMVNPKIYNGNKFILGTVGDSLCLSNTCLGEVLGLHDIGEILKRKNKDVKNLPHDLTNILNELDFDYHDKTLILYYYMDCEYNKYIFKAESSSHGEFNIYVNKNSFESYGTYKKLSNDLIKNILLQRYDTDDASMRTLQDCIPIMRDVLKPCINLSEISSYNNCIGYPILIYSINQEGFVTECNSNLYHHIEKSICE